jgi:hypothetical protein
MDSAGSRKVVRKFEGWEGNVSSVLVIKGCLSKERPKSRFSARNNPSSVLLLAHQALPPSTTILHLNSISHGGLV